LSIIAAGEYSAAMDSALSSPPFVDEIWSNQKAAVKSERFKDELDKNLNDAQGSTKDNIF
jgi:hypothetical protein